MTPQELIEALKARRKFRVMKEGLFMYTAGQLEDAKPDDKTFWVDKRGEYYCNAEVLEGKNKVRFYSFGMRQNWEEVFDIKHIEFAPVEAEESGS